MFLKNGINRHFLITRDFFCFNFEISSALRFHILVPSYQYTQSMVRVVDKPRCENTQNVRFDIAPQYQRWQNIRTLCQVIKCHNMSNWILYNVIKTHNMSNWSLCNVIKMHNMSNWILCNVINYTHNDLT